ncbi:hypothetical protein EDB80DRAFT_151998 [Ilyonectria destructans]|nr:hypothetical protein EDB80DRAFT_151998 [Ilyonectria destructans]
MPNSNQAIRYVRPAFSTHRHQAQSLALRLPQPVPSGCFGASRRIQEWVTEWTIIISHTLHAYQSCCSPIFARRLELPPMETKLWLQAPAPSPLKSEKNYPSAEDKGTQVASHRHQPTTGAARPNPTIPHNDAMCTQSRRQLLTLTGLPVLSTSTVTGNLTLNRQYTLTRKRRTSYVLLTLGIPFGNLHVGRTSGLVLGPG